MSIVSAGLSGPPVILHECQLDVHDGRKAKYRCEGGLVGGWASRGASLVSIPAYSSYKETVEKLHRPDLRPLSRVKTSSDELLVLRLNHTFGVFLLIRFAVQAYAASFYQNASSRRGTAAWL